MDVKTLIGSNVRPEGASSGGKPRGPTTASESESARTGAPSEESLTLTGTAKSMKAAQQSAGVVPFDAAKVGEIRAAIAAGQYPIDNEVLAGNILKLERLLA